MAQTVREHKATGQLSYFPCWAVGLDLHFICMIREKCTILLLWQRRGDIWLFQRILRVSEKVEALAECFTQGGGGMREIFWSFCAIEHPDAQCKCFSVCQHPHPSTCHHYLLNWSFLANRNIWPRMLHSENQKKQEDGERRRQMSDLCGRESCPHFICIRFHQWMSLMPLPAFGHKTMTFLCI